MDRFIFIVIYLLPFFAFSQKVDSTMLKTSFSAYPAFGYQPETSVQLGIVGVWVLKSQDSTQNIFQRQSTFTPFLLYTFRNQLVAEMNLDYYFRTGYNLNISLGYVKFPDFYYGIGNNNDPEVLEGYTSLSGQIEGQFYQPIGSKFFVGISFDLSSTDLRDKVDEGMLESDNLTGIDGGNILGFGPAFKLDTRNNVIYPSKGSLIAFQTIFNYLGDFNYTSCTIDFRKYFSTKNEKHIFAWQINTRFSLGEDVPFYRLPQLGGAARLRGITNASLYRDRQAVFTQLEYRKHLIWRLGLVAFAGIGDVVNKPTDFMLSELKYVIGTGLRFALLPEQKLNFRFDFGFSHEGQTAIYVGIREAF